MTRSVNLSGDSPITAFTAGEDFIDVRFAHGVYRDDTMRPGGAHMGDRNAAQKPV